MLPFIVKEWVRLLNSSRNSCCAKDIVAVFWVKL
jgi:hypothetical protein